MSKKLMAEENARMRKLMGFTYEDNSHEVLSEQNIRKAILKEQNQNTVLGTTDDTETTEIPFDEIQGRLKKIPATNANINNAMKVSIGSWGDPAIIDEKSFAAAWRIWPELGSALIERAKLKTMWGYYDKAGAMNFDLGKSLDNQNIPTINEEAVISRRGDTWMASPTVGSFLKGFNDYNIDLWKNKDKYYKLFTNKNAGNLNLNIIYYAVRVIPDNGQPSILRGKAEFVNNCTYQWEVMDERSKKLIQYAADFFIGNPGNGIINRVKDQTGGPQVMDELTKVIDFEKIKKKHLPKKVNTEPIGYMVWQPVSGVNIKKNLITGYLSGKKKGAKTQNLINPETGEEITPIEIADYDGSPSTGANAITFNTGEYSKAESKNMDNWIDGEIENLQNYITTQIGEPKEGRKVSINMGPITLISSASNVWNSKRVDPLPLQTGKNFNVGSDPDNNELAYNRGVTMIGEFKKKLEAAKQKGHFKNINFNDVYNVHWMVTDTGGVASPKGQWAKVTVGGGGEGTQTDETFTPGIGFAVGRTGYGYVRYRYAKSPGINWKQSPVGPKWLNSIRHFIGAGRNKSTKTNFAVKRNQDEL